MNRGFGYYFKKSSDLVSFVHGKQKLKDKLLFAVYVFASMIGKLFFLTRPLFLVADQNMANMIVNGHSFSILKAFEGTKERYFKVAFSELVTGLIYFTIILLMLIPGGLLFLNAISMQTFPFAVIVSVLLLIASIITCLALSYNFRFVSYVAAKNKELDFSDYLYNSRVSARGLKGMIFGNDVVTFLLAGLIPLLLIGLIALIGFVVGPLISSTATMSNYEETLLLARVVTIVLTLIVLTALVLLYINVFAPRLMKSVVFTYLIAEDNVKTSRSIVVKRKSSNKVEYEPLFDQPIKNEAVDLNK